ncbi:MAG: glutathione transport system permease protein, partial [Pseudonocardiales bacterium]|nr:glutathione transport system permease protein [Pseudonocardiales bacterium]
MNANLPELQPRIDDVDTQLSPLEERAATRGRRLTRRRLYLRRFLRNKGAVAGLVILALLILFALLGSLFTPYVFNDVDFTSLTMPPSPEHVFGTNETGNDTYAQAVHGLQRSLVIALSVSLLTTLISAFVGAAAAYFGGTT